MKDGHLCYNCGCHFAFDSDNPAPAGTTSALKFRPYTSTEDKKSMPYTFYQLASHRR